MSNGSKCGCSRCRCCGLMWPVVLITLGALFLIGEYSGRYSLSELWPILLIVIGVVKIAEALASTEGHTGS
jgi:cell wall-active antibiotic response 4TMS protein YvqF